MPGAFVETDSRSKASMQSIPENPASTLAGVEATRETKIAQRPDQKQRPPQPRPTTSTGAMGFIADPLDPDNERVPSPLRFSRPVAPVEPLYIPGFNPGKDPESGARPSLDSVEVFAAIEAQRPTVSGRFLQETPLTVPPRQTHRHHLAHHHGEPESLPESSFAHPEHDFERGLSSMVPPSADLPPSQDHDRASTHIETRPAARSILKPAQNNASPSIDQTADAERAAMGASISGLEDLIQQAVDLVDATNVRESTRDRARKPGRERAATTSFGRQPGRSSINPVSDPAVIGRSRWYDEEFSSTYSSISSLGEAGRGPRRSRPRTAQRTSFFPSAGATMRGAVPPIPDERHGSVVTD